MSTGEQLEYLAIQLVKAQDERDELLQLVERMKGEIKNWIDAGEKIHAEREVLRAELAELKARRCEDCKDGEPSMWDFIAGCGKKRETSK